MISLATARNNSIRRNDAILREKVENSIEHKHIIDM